MALVDITAVLRQPQEGVLLISGSKCTPQCLEAGRQWERTGIPDSGVPWGPWGPWWCWWIWKGTSGPWCFKSDLICAYSSAFRWCSMCRVEVHAEEIHMKIVQDWSLVGGLEHFFIFPYIRNHHPNWHSYSSEGLKPPTRSCLFWNCCSLVWFPITGGCWRVLFSIADSYWVIAIYIYIYIYLEVVVMKTIDIRWYSVIYQVLRDGVICNFRTPIFWPFPGWKQTLLELEHTWTRPIKSPVPLVAKPLLSHSGIWSFNLKTPGMLIVYLFCFKWVIVIIYAV